MDSHSAHNLVPIERALPRVHKVALGCAVGVVAGAGLSLLTVFHLVFGPEGVPIGLLSLYFPYYDLDWRGAVTGLGWGFLTGFVCGWSAGLVHNLTVGAWLLLVRLRTDLSRRRDFLDHIR